MQIKIFNSRQLNETQEVNLFLTTNNLQKECSIGRSPSASLVLDSADVSRLHGKIIQEGGNYYFIDIGSRNGSIVNGKLAEINQKYLLKPGDILRIGAFVLILEEVDVIRQDLAETVFSHTHAVAISDRQNLQEQFSIDEIQLDESGSDAGEATVIQLPSIVPEATEIPLSDRPTQIELDKIDPILELDPWQDLESEAKIERVSTPKSLVPKSAMPQSAVVKKDTTTNAASTFGSGKYIALMAHDRQRAELAQFVAQHQEFLSQHLTITTPATSATLQQAGIAVSAETPALPLGGYQAIANLVNSGNVLATIVLQDILELPRSEQETQEALMRSCHLNQVLLATNLATAEAIVHYLRSIHRLTNR
ncbi:FHA domain-containing protein [Scytonema millei]|uniref:FHA domain-containing protein n=1 Tax=Scytonema millei VB511283 TaxID=1245923 RepID=A0A9X5I5D5_9CYAN|nr:FHA domain-containing protein [Scytonema millei]NHC35896.1 FHA domain-containing protein [Scytonema millei VB511283]